MKLVLACAALLAFIAVTNAQSNLLQNPNADLQSQSWQPFGETTVEPCTNNGPCFVVRNQGYFLQDVKIPADAVGQYVLFIARASSERVNPDGAITGLPYLYGYMMAAADGPNDRILEYLQGQNMGLMNMKKDEWVTLWGIFQVPQGTGRIRFFLNQAEGKGIPQDGSAARFDDVGLYLFRTQQDARNFVNSHH